jgi:hypothetical protein
MPKIPRPYRGTVNSNRRKKKESKPLFPNQDDVNLSTKRSPKNHIKELAVPAEAAEQVTLPEKEKSNKLSVFINDQARVKSELATTHRERSSTLVSTNDMDDQAVTSDKIANNAIDSSKIKQGSIRTDALVNNAVDSSKLANQSVTSNKLANESVTSQHLAPSVVTAVKIANNSVSSHHINPSAIASEHIRDQAVTAEKLAFNPIQMAKGQSNTLQQFGFSPIQLSGTEKVSEVEIHFEDAFATEYYALVAITNHPHCVAALKEQKTNSAVISIARLKGRSNISGTLTWIALGEKELLATARGETEPAPEAHDEQA